jgi:hypothetical protein
LVYTAYAVFLIKSKNTHLSELTFERVVQYLEFISKDKIMDDWKINQAIDSVYFPRARLKPSPFRRTDFIYD